MAHDPAAPENTPLMVLVNGQARRGDQAEQALAALQAAGIHAELVQLGSEPVEAAVRRELAAGARAVVVGGGDGTLAQAVGPLVQSGVPLGVLPLGTGNTFARNLGVPLDLPGAAQLIAGGVVRHVDVGSVNGRYFLNSVTLGLSSLVALGLTRDLKRRLGLLAYAVAGWRALRSAGARRYRIQLDGAAPLELRTWQLIVANADDVARALKVPGADYADGRHVLLSLRGQTRLGVVLDGVRWLLGDTRGLRVWRFHHARIEASDGQPLEANIDGDVQTSPHLEVLAHRQALGVFVANRRELE